MIHATTQRAHADLRRSTDGEGVSETIPYRQVFSRMLCAKFPFDHFLTEQSVRHAGTLGVGCQIGELGRAVALMARGS
jgi:hypothetical protein